MPRVIENHEQIVRAFQSVEMISELVEKLPNGEFRNELEMDIILFGRSYRGKKVGPYARLLEYAPGETIVEAGTWESSIFYILVTGVLEASVTNAAGEREKLGEITPGNSFGEMALLSGTRRTATVSVDAEAVSARVLELTRPAIRLLRKLPRFGKALDRNYRAYGLTLTINELRDSDQFQFDEALLRRFTDAARFAVYEKGHVLFREGDPINRVFFIRNGWVERVKGMAFNPKAAELLIESDESVSLDFVGSGKYLGAEAVSDASAEWKYTAMVRGRTETLEVAVSRLREDGALRSGVMSFLSNRAEAATPEVSPHAADARSVLAASREIDTGVVDGINLLVMDMAKCIRCGNCSLACHKVHGQTRLVRRGIHIERPVRPTGTATQSVLVPSVCMHCRDAECLTGCPTGAIARFPDGEIDINNLTCIGCGDCATQCPYDAISMIVRPGSAKANPRGLSDRVASLFSLRAQSLPPAVEETEDLLAIKCNLCHGTPLNPAGATRQAYSCEENCPTGALVRVNPREYFDEINESIGLVRRTATHAIGVNIHRSDIRATMWHVGGIIATLVVGGLAFWFTRKFSQDALLLGSESWLTMRWMTGIVGLGGIVWAMLYPVRKQIYRRRAGALRYWMLSHVYLGVLAGVVLLVHGGTSSGGLITTALMISFDLVIASGILGAVCYIFVPRLMTRIEREPLLVEDLEARQAELRAELVRAAEQAVTPEVRRLVRVDVRRRFLNFSYLLRQYLKREDLNTMLAGARREFHHEVVRLTQAEDTQLMDAVENAATLRRVDALVYLHSLLKVWVAPHVLFTAIMLLLMVFHMAQVIYFNVR
jgi:Fe-S-cluster-containing dehydrogenase component/CRP-like cAMP-binding protein